jgi:DNA-binding response OmpR family regulator
MKKILVVEDDKKYREILSETLTQEGFLVLTAENGEEGIIIAEKQEIDLILLDLLMPKVDGVTFYYRLKNILKKHVPVIVLTNLAETAAYDADIKDVMIKANVSLEDVIKKVKENLKV